MPLTKQQEKQLKSLGERVQQLRVEKGLSLQDLAHSIGKDRQSIHRLESGGVNPSYLYLDEICQGLEMTVSELLDGL